MDIVEQTPTQLVLSGGRVWLVAGSAVAIGVLGLLLIMLPNWFGLPTGLGVAMGIVMIAIAAGIMASVQIITWTFDKKRSTVETLREGLVTADRQTFKLHEIRAIEAEPSPLNSLKFRLVVRDKFGQVSPLSPKYTLSQAKANQLIDTISRFLN